MGTEANGLHVLFFPLMASGHLLPTLDIAKLFAARGVTATILTTPANAHLVQPAIDRSGGIPIRLVFIHFPAPIPNLPPSHENLTPLRSQSERMLFLSSLAGLRQPFFQALQDLRPDCIVSDMFFPWTLAVADELGIPRLVFHGNNFFALCIGNAIARHQAGLGGGDSVVLPGLPHRIEMRRAQLPDGSRFSPEFRQLFFDMAEAEDQSLGVVVNSFYELEPNYADHYRNIVGRRAWAVGPVSLCNRDFADKTSRGDKASFNCDDCLTWLDSKPTHSVVYVCFGSTFDMPASQLRELAEGLEACNHPFIWVIKVVEGCTAELLPEGYEERVVGKGKGFIIKGWAPQLLLLSHAAVGGFVTHCGWNSSLEGLSEGLPVVTWPLFADQFYNEKLLVDVLEVGVRVGAEEYVMEEGEMSTVRAERVREAVERMMGEGEEGERRRRRGREISVMARRAVETGGSSEKELKELIRELCERREAKGREVDKDIIYGI